MILINSSVSNFVCFHKIWFLFYKKGKPDSFVSLAKSQSKLMIYLTKDDSQSPGSLYLRKFTAMENKLKLWAGVFVGNQLH